MECGVKNALEIETKSTEKHNLKLKQHKEESAESNVLTAASTAGANDVQKSYRKRKRHHYNAIRSQMEFYFGDANLSKDRFLKQLIDKDPFVPLEVFLSFNKLKALTNSAEEIAKSLSNSQLLELNETQQKVRRKTALPAERNVDEKTVYVEALPAAADHDWVRQAFERFGSVTYVSLPKYTKTRKIKGFGFVEFEQESSVEKAINAFKEFNGVLKMQEADPAELQSVKAFVKEQKQEHDVEQLQESTEKKAKKRGRLADGQDEGGRPLEKKSKIEAEEGNNTTTTETGSESACDEDEAAQPSGDEVAGTKKKRRKKKHKAKNAEKRRKDTDLNTDVSFYELKILPKRDWKRLRNKYLNLQREKVAELKRKAWKEQQQQTEREAKENASTDALDVPTPSKKHKPNERKLRKMNMNFYGAGEDESKNQVKEVKHNPALERAPLFSFAEGLIVEVSFLEPCVNVKEFKADMRQYETVKYVDVKEGAMHANLRLESATAATDFVRQVNCAEYTCKVLTGEAEAEYWKKIEQDREMKLNKQVKVPQKRGRQKVKKLVTKHIRFGEDDDEQ